MIKIPKYCPGDWVIWGTSMPIMAKISSFHVDTNRSFDGNGEWVYDLELVSTNFLGQRIARIPEENLFPMKQEDFAREMAK